MPRRVQGPKLDKVVSSNISSADFDLLLKYAKILYNGNYISQPTLSHLIRHIIEKWVYQRRIQEKRPKGPASAGTDRF